LDQDYMGKKELIIINDCVEQTLVFSHPLVKIINLPYRVKTIGEKRNISATYAQYDWFLPWDDDDINLPWRLSHSIDMVQTHNTPLYNPNAIIGLSGSGKKCHLKAIGRTSCYHASCIMSREVFEEVKGYDVLLNSGEDQDLERRIRTTDAWISGGTPPRIDDSDVYYLYRWNNNRYHISATGVDNNSQLQYVYSYVQNLFAKKKEPEGRIVLVPGHQKDYVEMVHTLLSKTTGTVRTRPQTTQKGQQGTASAGCSKKPKTTLIVVIGTVLAIACIVFSIVWYIYR
jgi:hypothetical protein